MKLYLRDQVNPKIITELKAGIRMYWKILTPEVCRKFVGYQRKVIPKVIVLSKWGAIRILSSIKLCSVMFLYVHVANSH